MARRSQQNAAGAAGAGEHGNGCLGIGIESPERIEQFSRRGAIDRIAAMRTIDGDDGHRSIAFDKNCACVGHVCAPDRRQHSNGYLLSE